MQRSCVLLALAALACCALPLASGHMCVFDPPQRGDMHLDHPGDSTCAHFGPDVCGGIAAGAVQASFKAGQSASIRFQQNLNHFSSAAVKAGQAGFFSAQVAPGAQPKEQQFVEIATNILDIDVMDEVWVGNFTLNATMPSFTCNPCTLRLQYSPSGSKDISDNFIQCVDIALTASEHPNEGLAASQLFGSRSAAPPTKRPSLQPNAMDCCAPKQFESRFVQGAADGRVSYDAVNQLVAYMLPQDTPQDGAPGGVPDGFYYHYVNFSSQTEYVFDAVQNTCVTHSTDPWEDWCYGSSQNEEFEHSVTVAGTTVNMFVNAPANMYFGATADSCLPVVRERLHEGLIMYFDTTLGIADPSVFTPPAVCAGADAASGAQQTHSARLPARRGRCHVKFVGAH